MEANINPVTGIMNVEAIEAAMGTFQRQHQRRASNLLQCMDRDGNIDAFRYIEYSRQRRMEFLKRAEFICRMKSTIQSQHQQQMHRSASLPGTTVPSALPSVQPMTKEAFTGNDGNTSSGPTGDINTLKSLGGNTVERTAVLNTPNTIRLMSRSASMPLASSFASNTTITGTKTVSPASTTQDKNDIEEEEKGSNDTKVESPSSESRPTQRRKLAKDELEAAEALFFGIRRASLDTSPSSGNDKGSIGNDCDSKSADDLATKKRKMSDLPQGGTHSRSEEMETIVSIVSAEEECSNSINNCNSSETDEDIVTETMK